MSRVRVVLVRHAETALNVQDRYQARVDVPLTATGVQQARAAAAALRPGRWAGVWSSPAERAAATAYALADALGTVAYELPELLERDLGTLDGQDRAAHRLADPAQARRLVTDASYAPPGGESLAAVLVRLCRGLAQVVTVGDGDERPLLAVTHGGVLNALALALLGGAGPVGNARAVALTLHGLGGGEPVTGAVPLWDVPPHACETPWPAAAPAGVLPWPDHPPFPS